MLGNEYHDYETAKSTLKLLSFEQSVFLNKAKIMFKWFGSELFDRRSEIALALTERKVTVGYLLLSFTSLSRLR